MSLYNAFLAAPFAEKDGIYPAISLGLERKDFLAKGADGNPIFLLHDASAPTYCPSIELRTILVQFQSTCQIVIDNQVLEDQFAIISCNASVPELFEIFICCIGAAIDRLPTSAGTQDLEACVNELLELFSSLASPGAREISGLWAELFIISRADNIAAAIAVWQADQFERFDFSSQKGCLEVKATSNEHRIHEFALEQLETPLNGRGLVASILLQSQSGGVGILDLARKIESAVIVDPALRKRLWKNIASSLGKDFADRLDRKFDLSYAERNVIFYEMTDIPSLKVARDERISCIRFRSNLSGVQSSLPAPRGDGLQLLLI